MALNPTISPTRSPSSSPYFHLLAKPVSHSPIPSKISASLRPQPHSRPQYSCHLHIPPSSNSNYRTCSGDLSPLQMRFSEEGFDFFKLWAGPPGGSVGDGSYGGSSGGGRGDDDGRGEEEGGGNNHSLLSWYLMSLEKHPVVTKAVTSAFLTFVGDSICQLLIDRAPTLDLKRTFLFTFLGFVLVGPTLHFW